MCFCALLSKIAFLILFYNSNAKTNTKFLMKKLFLPALLVAMCLGASAQTRLDLGSRAKLRQMRMEQAKPADSEYSKYASKLKTLMNVNPDHALAILKVDDDATVARLEENGVNVMRHTLGFAFVSMPVDQVEKVAGLQGVRRLQLARSVQTKNKFARQSTGVDLIHSGTGLTKAYTGKNVVCGIVDSGLDPNHINFKDDEGNSRVGLLSYAKISNDGSKINFKYYERDQVSQFTTDTSDSYHGTHTMGTMAGSYRGEATVALPDANKQLADVSVTLNPYYGVAYDADIVAACGDLLDYVIAVGVEDMLNYAIENHKPCVINLSLGSNDGPHDGTGVINQFFDACAKELNAIICVAAGNEADLTIAAHKTFTDDDKEFKTFIEGYDYNGSYVRYGSTSVYSNDDKPFTKVQAVVYNTSRGNVSTRLNIEIDPDKSTGGTSKYWVTSADWQESDTDILHGTLGASFQGYIGIGYDWDSESGRFYVMFDYTLYNGGTGIGAQGNHNHEYYVGLLINGESGQRIDVFCDGQMSFLSDNSVAGWQNGTADGSISDMATGKDILVVGSYNTADCWGSISDGYTYFPGYSVPVNEITNFSSWGTLYDGRTLPHVLAPGATIVSSYNRYYTPETGSVAASVPGQIHNNEWGWALGTSMATPHVTGAIALWLEADPTLTINDVKEIIEATAVKDEYTAVNPVQSGWGKFNAYEGLKEVLRRAESGINDVQADNRLLVTPMGDNVFEVFVAGQSKLCTSVYSTSGALVAQRTNAGDTATIDLSSLTPGSYIINVNGKVSKCVIIK